MLKKWNMRLAEPLRSIVLSGLWGGVIPVLSFMYVLWVDDKYLTDAQLYLPSPLAIPVCCVFSVTSFPAMIFFVTVGAIQKSYGNPAIIDALDPRTQISIGFALSIFFNMCVHWIFWRFIWQSKAHLQNTNETEISYDLKIFWANLVGGAFVFFALIESLFYSELLLVTLMLLIIGLSLLAYAYKKGKSEKENSKDF